MSRHEIIEKIRMAMRRFNPHCKTILYGSQARGEAREDSDIDLLILVDSENSRLTIAEEQRITDPLFDIEVETGVQISPLVMLKRQWEGRPFPTPFSLKILKDGIEL